MGRTKVKIRRTRSRSKLDPTKVILLCTFLFLIFVIVNKRYLGRENVPVVVEPVQSQQDTLTTLATSQLVEVVAPTVHIPSDKPKNVARMPKKGDYLLIEKSKHTLSHYREGELLASYSVALGKNPADKAKAGDNATPVGHFQVDFIYDSSTWTHNFGDGKGEIKGAYGPYFIALRTDANGTWSGKTWTGIGIHGTHDPASIGTNASEGCIRLNNNELKKLKANIEDKEYVAVDIIE